MTSIDLKLINGLVARDARFVSLASYRALTKKETSEWKTIRTTLAELGVDT